MGFIIEILKNYLSKDQPLISNLAILATLLGILFTVSQLIWKFFKFRSNRVTQKNLLRKLTHFSKQDILRATQYYIPTQWQKLDPIVTMKPKRVQAFDKGKNLISFFMNQVFTEKKDEKYYLILADSGMGKTTFMINLFLKYTQKWNKPFSIKLLPLGLQTIDTQIEAIENKPVTILLLDAFDEDIRAAHNFSTRMQEIIKKTMDFQTVIITSRTQFFPSDPDIPQETGLYKFGGDKGIHQIQPLYILPFNTREINEYLRKRFPFYQIMKRNKARSIVEKSPDLMMRPMLLSYIDDLLERPVPYKLTCDIYEIMIKKWIKRERVENKEELRRFSEVIAHDMYENQQIRGGLYIDNQNINEFANKFNIRLEEFEMRSCSLLNRNAEGKYKFAHKSILEYLLSLEIIKDSNFGKHFNYENMEQVKYFLRELHYYSLIKLSGFFQLMEKNVISSDFKKEIDLNKLYYEELDNVGNLYIWENQTTDISSMADLINLHVLILQNNHIIDISPIAALKKLHILSMSNNQISDISPIAQLENIEAFDLSNNQITDISPIAALKKLHILSMSNNQITDISPIAKLENIKELYLRNNQITDILALAQQGNIKNLDISNNHIIDISPIAQLKNIEVLNLSNNRISDISVLAQLGNIKNLDISNNQIADISPIAQLKNIKGLNLSNNKIINISILAKLPNLRELNISNNQITDISPLLALENLERVSLAKNMNINRSAITDLKKMEIQIFE